MRRKNPCFGRCNYPLVLEREATQPSHKIRNHQLCSLGLQLHNSSSSFHIFSLSVLPFNFPVFQRQSIIIACLVSRGMSFNFCSGAILSQSIMPPCLEVTTIHPSIDSSSTSSHISPRKPLTSGLSALSKHRSHLCFDVLKAFFDAVRMIFELCRCFF